MSEAGSAREWEHQAQEWAMVPPGLPRPFRTSVLSDRAKGLDPGGNPAVGRCLLVTCEGETSHEAGLRARRVARFVSAALWLVAANAAAGDGLTRSWDTEPEARAFYLASVPLRDTDRHPLVAWALARMELVRLELQSPVMDALDHLTDAGLADFP